MSEFAPPTPGWVFYTVTRTVGLLGYTLCPMRIFGAERIPWDGPAVLLPNHESYLDPLFLACATSRPIRFMAKRELFRGFGKWLFPRLNCFPVSRGQADVPAYRNASRTLAAKKLLCIFLEGTRSETGCLQKAQAGAISIALRAEVPLLPVAISGTWSVLPPHGKLRLRPVAIQIGEPMVFSRLNRKARADREVANRVGACIMEEIARLRRQLEAEFGSRSGQPGRL